MSINRERLLSTFLELVQIDSPSGEEAAVAAYCKDVLEAAGCTVRFDDSAQITGSDTGNLFAILPAFSCASKPLYLSAHMDCIEPCRGVKPLVSEGFIHTDGTTVLGGDDKVGIAAILEVVRCLQESKAGEGIPHPEIRILLTVMEEVGLRGAKAVDAREFANTQGAYCFVLDAGGKPGLVVNGAPYQFSYKAQIKGLAAHAGIAPDAGISAIRAAARAVAQLPQGRIDEETTTNVGIIQGGSATNVVAESCLITGELRSHSLEKLKALRDEIEAVFRAALADDGTGAGAASIELLWEVNYEGFFIPEDEPQVAKVLSAARKLGLAAGAEISGGGADTNVLAQQGLAAVTLGSGMDRVHSTEERLAVADLENLALLVFEIVREG